ncbi:MAG TPA: AraC family transcriptional regulator [Steroidobacteraceae bacterium]|nr:AraC family transcriptional regulator [Steroidobacteraceae bacterium]
MIPADRRQSAQESRPQATGGLVRTALAGAGHSLAEAFANLDRAPEIQQITRHPQRKLIGARLAVKPEDGQGYWDLTQIGEDVYVVVLNFAYKDPRVEMLPGDGLIQFYFKLCGDLTMEVSRTEPLRLNHPSLLVYSQPAGLDLQEWTAPSVRERSVAISLRPEFLLENFLTAVVDAPPQLQALISVSPGQLRYCQLPLTTAMFDIATRLVDNPYTGILSLLHAEALTMELLCTAVAGFSTLGHSPSKEYSEIDLRCLHAARSFLMKQLSPAPTIRQVARAVGMNETYLKRGFRAVFGETLFAFSVRCRMQQALTLLVREPRLPVARVAEAVGYSHQTSFATAFRRHFGVCPKDARLPRSRMAHSFDAGPSTPR